MTSAQLAHLAELAQDAADYFSHTDPAPAATFAHTAEMAHRLSDQLRQAERARSLHGSEAKATD